MSVEAVGGWALKLIWTPFVAWLWYLQKRKDKRDDDLVERVNNTYTKQEADERMDMKIQLIHQQLNMIPEIMAKVDKMSDKVSEIHTDVEVVKSKVNDKDK